jgi:YegS/Rv2252/BmrU family lipid kinase
MKLALIFNPAAAHGRAIKLLPAIGKFFQNKAVAVDIYQTRYPGDGVTQTSQLNFDEYDGLVAAGGDGTLFEVVNGYFQNPSPRRIPLGILPTGTGNAFIRDMEPPITDWEEAAAIICQNRPRKVDVGRFVTEGQTYHYLNILGLGFVSDVCLIAHSLKLFGNLSYTLGVIWRTIFLKTYHLSIDLDGQRLEEENIFVEISNSRWTSNFLMAPRAQIDDGLLDVTLVRKLSRRRLLQCFPKIFTGEHIFMPEVAQYQVRQLKVETSTPKLLTPDGELMGSTPIEVECLHQALEVFWR